MNKKEATMAIPMALLESNKTTNNNAKFTI